MDNGGLGLVLEADGVRVGSAIGYVARGRSRETTIGVVYYVYVKPTHWGLGFGKILVSSLEELLAKRGATLYLASTVESNRRSQSMFESLGYKVLTWSKLEEELDYEVVEALEMAACMYEDDIVMIKPYDKRILSKIRREDYENLWYRICYKPWLKHRYRVYA